MYLYFSGLPEGQNFDNLHKQVYGPIERKRTIVSALEKPKDIREIDRSTSTYISYCKFL